MKKMKYEGLTVEELRNRIEQEEKRVGICRFLFCVLLFIGALFAGIAIFLIAKNKSFDATSIVLWLLIVPGVLSFIVASIVFLVKEKLLVQIQEEEALYAVQSGIVGSYFDAPGKQGR